MQFNLPLEFIYRYWNQVYTKHENLFSISLELDQKQAWFSPVLESPGKSWNLAEILEKSWKSPGIFLRSSTPKEGYLSKHQHFLGFLCMLNLAVHWLNCFDFHLRCIRCNNVYIQGVIQNFFFGGASSKKCDHDCDQALILPTSG